MEQLFAPYRGRATISCFSQAFNPKSRGCVRLRSSHPYDPPIVDPNYYDNEEDIENAVAGKQKQLFYRYKQWRVIFIGFDRFLTYKDKTHCLSLYPARD